MMEDFCNMNVKHKIFCFHCSVSVVVYEAFDSYL